MIAVLFISGALVSGWMVINAEHAMRKELLAKAGMVAKDLNPRRLVRLSVTPGMMTPEYKRLNGQLTSIVTADGTIRGLYLLGRKDDGRVFTWVDSRVSGSGNESPESRVLEKISADIARVFNTKDPSVVGPVPGTSRPFVTALVPVIHPKSDKLLAVLGMDVDAGNWRADRARAAIPPSAAALSLILIAITGRFFSSRRRSGPAVHGGQPFPEMLMAAASGIVLTLFAAWFANNRETVSRKEMFQILANEKCSSMMENFFDLRDIELEGLARFIENSRDVTASGFHRYNEHLVVNPYVRGWEWIPVVPSDQKPRFEAWVAAQGMTGFSIWEKDPDGNRIPAGGRKAYYPACFVSPLPGNAALLGFDLGSEPLRRKALEEAMETGLVTSTEPISLVQDVEDQKVIVIFRPVFSTDGKRTPRGFAVAVLRMGDFLQCAKPDRNIGLSLFLLSPGSTPFPLASSRHDKSASPWRFSRTIPVFGKTFLVRANPGPDFERNDPPRAGMLVLFSGLCLTAALTGIIGVTLNRRRRLEEMVATRTRAMEKSQTHLATLVRTLPDIIWLKDPKGVYLNCNPRFEQLFGAREAEIVGKTDDDFADRGLAEFFREKDEAAMASGKLCINEEEITFTSDGHRERVETIKTPMFDTDGTLIGVLGIAHDITAQRKAEDALRAERDLFTAGPVFIIAWGPGESWPVTFVSENVRHILGYSSGEMTSDTFRYTGLIHPDDYDRVTKEVRVYFESGASHYEQSYRLRIRSGEYRWFYDYTHLIRNGKGQVAAIHGYMFDQTDHKKAEIALKNSYNRTLALMAAVQAGIILVRRSDRIIVEANHVAITLVGGNSDDIVGKACTEVFCMGRTGVCPVFDYGGAMDTGERLLRKSSGERIPVLKTACPVRLEDEDFILESFVDIRKQKETEERLKNSEENFRSFFESVEDMIFVADPSGEIIHANAAVTRKLGYPSDEIRGMRIADVYPAQERREAETMVTAMLNGERVSCLLPLSHKNGTRVAAELRAWFGKWDGMDCVFGIIKDLTAEQEAQQRF
jgi:PAS domain S-box-containing protein